MDKFIIIDNCTKNELKAILKNWLVMYVNQLKSKSVFEFAEIKPNNFILKIDKHIDDLHFFFLVNYFAYPIDFKKTFEVIGYATASKYKEILNKNIYVFTHKQDTEFDNVWITTEDNETYKFDFGENFTKISENNYEYIKPTIEISPIFYEQIIFNKKELVEEAEKNKTKAERKLERISKTFKIEVRFKRISTILFIGIPIAFLIKQLIHNNYVDILLPLLVAVTIITWFTEDYKIFYSRQRILICILLSLLFAFLNVNTNVFFDVKINAFFDAIATAPMSSVIVVLLANKLLGTKLDTIMSSKSSWGLEYDRLFFVIVLVLSALISVFVFNPILKCIMK